MRRPIGNRPALTEEADCKSAATTTFRASSRHPAAPGDIDMAKKLDSEALKKNQFWIGLGAFVLIWLIAVIVVLFSGDPTPKKNWEPAKTKIDSAKKTRPKTPAYQEPWKAYGTMFSNHKDRIWQEAWKQQQGMYDWPKGMAVVPQYPDDTWGQDDLNNRSAFRDLYKTQFTNIDRVVAPVELAGGLAGIVPMQTW